MVKIEDAPQYTEEKVRFVDLMFLTGPHSLILKEGDDFHEETQAITIVLKSGPYPERIIVNTANLLWYSQRDGVIRKPVKKEVK